MGHRVLGASPRDVHRTGVLPIAGTTLQDASVEPDRALRRLYDVKQAYGFGGASQAVATGRAGYRSEDTLLDEFGEDLGEIPGRDIHLVGDFAGLATAAVVPGEVEHSPH